MARADAALQGCWGSSRIHPGLKSMRRTKCAAGNSLCSRCCCCFFSHITSDHPSAKKKKKKRREDPGPSCPSLWGFAVLLEKEATSRGHTIYGDGDPIEYCERRPPGTSQRMLALFFPKGEIEAWREVASPKLEAIGAQCVSCSAEL